MARRLIALVLLAAACAEPAPPTLAVGSLEAALPASIWPDDPSLVRSVSCPDLDVELIAQTVVCTATLDADPVTIDVEIDELGAASAAVRETLFEVAEASDELAARLADDLSIDAIQASCESTVVVPEPGRVLDCEATSDDRAIAFTMVLGRADDDWVLELAD